MKTSKPHQDEPWSFEDGPEVAKRIEREYARRLLESLPHLPEDATCTDAMVEGYRMLTYALVTAARTHQRLNDRAITAKTTARRQATAVRSMWRLAHLHLVACQLRAFELAGSPHDELTLVRLAEHRIEELVADVGDKP